MSISASPAAVSSWVLSLWQGSLAPNGWLPSKDPPHQKTLETLFDNFFCHLITVDPQPMNSIQPLRLTAENLRSVTSIIYRSQEIVGTLTQMRIKAGSHPSQREHSWRGAREATEIVSTNITHILPWPSTGINAGCTLNESAVGLVKLPW